MVYFFYENIRSCVVGAEPVERELTDVSQASPY